MSRHAGALKWVKPHDLSIGEYVLGYQQGLSNTDCKSDHNREYDEAELQNQEIYLLQVFPQTDILRVLYYNIT